MTAGDITDSVEVSAPEQPEQPEGGGFPIIPVAAGVVVVIAMFAYKRRGR